MTIQEHIDYWFDTAEKDMEVVNNLFENGHYSWCLFIGHLVIEKSLKGYWVFKFNETPPKIHDLITLAKSSDLQLDEDMTRFFFIMNKFQMEARYPDYKNEVSKIASKEFSKDKFDKIIEIHRWLKSLTK